MIAYTAVVTCGTEGKKRSPLCEVSRVLYSRAPPGSNAHWAAVDAEWRKDGKVWRCPECIKYAKGRKS